MTTEFARPCRLGTEPATHLYSVEIVNPAECRRGIERVSIEVLANNRDQATRIATRAGYEVCSVNMVG